MCIGARVVLLVLVFAVLYLCGLLGTVEPLFVPVVV